VVKKEDGGGIVVVGEVTPKRAGKGGARTGGQLNLIEKIEGKKPAPTTRQLTGKEKQQTAPSLQTARLVHKKGKGPDVTSTERVI